MVFIDNRWLTNQRSANDDTATLILVPFVRPGEGFVNSLMNFRMTQTDTVWRGMRDWQYSDLVHDSTNTDSTRWISRDALNIFMALDAVVFGTEEFEVSDGRILGRNLQDTFWVSLVNHQLEGKNSYTQKGATLIVPAPSICNEIIVCTPESSNPLCFNSEGCTIVWTMGGGGGWFPWQNNGGGGSGGGYDPPQCSNNQSRGSVVWGCPWGWRPRNYVPPSPVNDSTFASRLNRLMGNTMNQINIDSLHSVAQQDGNERTFTFNRNPNGDTAVIFPYHGNSHSSQPVLFYTSFGFFHTHQEDDPIGGSDKNQCFDGPDIFKFYKNTIVDNYPLTVSVVSTRDFFYAMVITDFNKFKIYIDSLCGSPKDIKVLAKNLNNLHVEAWDNCTGCTWQNGSEAGTLAVTANNNSSISGVKVFRSPRQNINFTVLTP